MKLFVLMPVKSFHSAKQRLSSVLSPAEREALAEAMFRDVLDRTISSAAVSAVFVVTADPKAGQIASAQGARVIPDTAELGETDAVSLALARLNQGGLPSALIIPSDIPMIGSGDLDLILEQAETCAASGPEFGLLIPCRKHDGTNALLLSPPGLILPRFGQNSFFRHLSYLRARGIRHCVVENENIGLDIDNADDLKCLLTQKIMGRTRDKLVEFQRIQSQLGASIGARDEAT